MCGLVDRAIGLEILGSIPNGALGEKCWAQFSFHLAIMGTWRNKERYISNNGYPMERRKLNCNDWL